MPSRTACTLLGLGLTGLLSPGGAAVMTLMSDAYGGDMRLVAVMQYLRVAIVTVLATVVAAKAPKPGVDFFPLTVDVEERSYDGSHHVP